MLLASTLVALVATHAPAARATVRSAPAQGTRSTAPSGRGRALAVEAALVPTRDRLSIGDTLETVLRLTAQGPGFNGYDAVIAFDPAVLKYLEPAAARDLEGEAMTAPCGNTFHRLRAAGDSVVIAHVVLCPGVSLTGPGELHRLRFRALAAGRTTLRLQRTQFYDAGRYLSPARIVHASATIGRGPRPRPTPTGEDRP